MEYKSYYNSSIGKIILSSDGESLTGLWFSTSRFKEKTLVDMSQVKDNLEVFKITRKWLDKYFEEKMPNPSDVPIKLIGSNFSIKVWNILKSIPYGKIVTYGDIAQKMAKDENIKRMSSQAVGHAVGYNPISIIIPCHRVIGANGNLVGYGGGLDKKIELLKLEKVNTKDLYIPKKGNAL